MTIGERIKQARKNAGLTQEDLARILGVKYQMIGQYENGKRKPKIETLYKIAHALDVSVTELVEPNALQIANDMLELFAGSQTLEMLADCTQIDELYCQLNEKGQKKAIEQVELLTKIPEYQKENNK